MLVLGTAELNEFIMKRRVGLTLWSKYSEYLFLLIFHVFPLPRQVSDQDIKSLSPLLGFTVLGKEQGQESQTDCCQKSIVKEFPPDLRLQQTCLTTLQIFH